MMTENGWIKLHRKVLENPVVCHDAEYFAVWVYLLLNASHEKYSTWFNGKRKELDAGQLVTGRQKIAHELKMNEHKVDRALKLFENEQQIEQQCTSHGRLISITNWEQYQKVEQPIEHQVSNQCATSEQPVSTKQEDKECKKVKKSINRTFKKPSLEEVTAYCSERGNSIDPQKFIDYYESNGWMVGKNHMKDWKATVRNWERRNGDGVKQEPQEDSWTRMIREYENQGTDRDNIAAGWGIT